MYLQACPTKLTSRLHPWMCVCARDRTLLHEDEMRMIQVKAFFSLVPLFVGTSDELRGNDSTLGAVPIRFLPGIISKARCFAGRIAQER